jgi:acetylornithine deacetylase
VAALHAVAAVQGLASAEVVLQAVGSEEDGGLGTFAALERDDRFDAALLPEPTAFAVACSQAGALTFTGTIPGVSAHAAARLEGVSAIDRYVEVHRALAEHERALNQDVADPLMAALPLPYPLSVGRIEGGEWSSQVPDRLEFEGRLGVAVGDDPARARAELEAVVAAALDDGSPPAEISWTGGSFAPAETPADHPWVALVSGALEDELGRPVEPTGVPWGADMRHYTTRGIPCTMAGTRGIELAHAVDEHVELSELVALARGIVRVVARAAALI